MNYENILKKMTLEQKCVILSGADVFKTYAFELPEIPAIWFSDGPHGLRKQAGASDHLGLNPSEEATCFPTAAAAACSWDEALGEEIGESLGREAAAQGVNVVLGPGLNMKRNPLCGRNFEYFSEDPYLAGKMAASYIRGIQKNGLAACPKHFVVNNQETRRMVSDSIVDERTLREIYLTGFEIAVKEGHPKSIMSSYNLVNGVYANENKKLLTDILKNEWGFDGAVVTDWGGSNDHAEGVKAGSALEMPCPGLDSARELLNAVKKGSLSEKTIDARVSELLKLVYETNEALSKAKSTVRSGTGVSAENISEALFKKHHDLARTAAESCITLLKNEGSLLPLSKGTKVALIGDFAETPRYQGAGSSVVNTKFVENLLDCFRQGSAAELIGYAKGFDRLGAQNETLAGEAVTLAKKAEVVVLCLGLDEVQESEGLDRTGIRLAKNQTSLLKVLSAVNKNLVIVLSAGSVVETPWRKNCRALLYGGLLGEAGAGALYDVLTGKVNPAGKLAETWPENYRQVPSGKHFAGKGRTTEYRESIYIGYRYYQKVKAKTAFCFGHGLSYTTFTYSDISAGEKAVTFKIKNTGSRDGTEIAQLYISRPGKEVFSPVRELKGFARVSLKAGEEKEVTIQLDDKAFRYWNVKTDRWEIEGGTYTAAIGASCEDIRLTASFFAEGSNAAKPYEEALVPNYMKGTVTDISDEEFEVLLGHKIPENKSQIGRNMTIGELNHGKSPLGWIVWSILTVLLRRSMRKGQPDLNLLFMYNMPLRALAKMTNGMVSMGMVDGIVMEVKGFWFIGIVKVVKEFLVNIRENRKMKRRIL